MKISYNWLKDYIQTDLPAPEIGRILTDIGLEVEGVEKIESIRGGLEGLVVAEVLTCVDHPDSDHLHITTVSIGDGQEPVQVVCGAPNVAQGQKVILAQVGATLYPVDAEEGFKIKKSKIRGAESHGMICAEDEIGVGKSHEGIIVLDTSAVPGTPAAEVFNRQGDYMLEIGLTPNRIDAASHYGVARDLAAYLSLHGDKTGPLSVRAELPDLSGFKVDDPNGLPVKVTVEAPEGAPRYMGITVKDLKVGPSPEWLQARLRTVGLNPKNNLVDITNYVMYECGVPLHAFDMAKVEGGEVVVRRAKDGEPFVTLDGIERKLSKEDLMICDAQKPMCIAGVFGGANSGVSDSTTDVFIESAYFNPVTVRKSARRYGLNTDASFRFERGADPSMQPFALKRAAMLMKELGGGTIASEIVDLYPVHIEPFRFEIDLPRINRLLGETIPADSVRKMLESLEVGIEKEQGDVWSVAVPPYRVDVQREADLAEDLLRLYGYNRVPMPHYIKNVITYGNQKTPDKLLNTASDLLVSLSAVEIMSNSLTKAAYYENLNSYPIEHCVRILNPLSNELNVMRQTLLFNALEAVVLNANRKNGDLKLFEVGNCYFYDPSKATEETKGTLKPYTERQKLAITVTGAAVKGSWNEKAQPSDFYTVKTLTERMLERFRINLYEGKYETLQSDLYSEAVSYVIRGKALFQIGVVSTKIAKGVFDLKVPVYYMELDVAHLARIAETVKVTATDLSKFPEVKRDLALLVDKGVTFSELREAAYKGEKKLLKSVGLFDVYEGDKLPEGKKSYALSFVLEDATKTLTDSEIDRIMGSIGQSMEKATGAQVRA